MLFELCILLFVISNFYMNFYQNSKLDVYKRQSPHSSNSLITFTVYLGFALVINVIVTML